jgi:large subunit ribosomal protein L1
MATIIDGVREAKEKSRKRKFVQTVDLLINVKNIDLKKPENRFSSEFFLPNGRGKDVKTAIIADSMATEAKKHADLVIRKEEIPGLVGNKKKLKRVANEYDWFFAEITLMAQIGKLLGTVLGPRGKMPKPIPPKVPIEPFVKRAKSQVRVVLKETPVIQVVVGNEGMEDGKIAENVQAVLNFVNEKLPKGKNSVKSVYLKLTMGPVVKLEV